MQGYPPASSSIEFARKVLWSTERPSFYEVEDAVSALPAARAEVNRWPDEQTNYHQADQEASGEAHHGGGLEGRLCRLRDRR